MQTIGAICFSLFLAGLLAGCGVGSITDRYGNAYGGWYDPGDNYRWQLELCERQMEQQGVPATARKLAMRCCMHDHGAPIDDPRCRA